MTHLALVTDQVGLPIDFDMPLLQDACRSVGVRSTVCHWDDPGVPWASFDAVVPRSPWSYMERLDDFLNWCRRVSGLTQLVNSVAVAEWALDKHYLADLAAAGIPTIPSVFVEPGDEVGPDMFTAVPLADADGLVIKPAVGANSYDVRRFDRTDHLAAAAHLATLVGEGRSAIVQPYVPSVDERGEADLVYFGGEFSHAIRKSARLGADGTVEESTMEARSLLTPDRAEHEVAAAALAVAARQTGMSCLAYGRADLVRGADGRPLVLELEICEPSLSLPLRPEHAPRMVRAVLDAMA